MKPGACPRVGGGMLGRGGHSLSWPLLREKGAVPWGKEQTLLAGWEGEGKQSMTYGVAVICNGSAAFIFSFLVLLQSALLRGKDPVASAPSLLQTDGNW